MKLVVKTTTHYPDYDTCEFYVTKDIAESLMDRISRELWQKVNQGELQDFKIILYDE